MSRRTVHFPDSLDDLENPPYPPEPPFAMVESREAEYERLMAESMSVMPSLPLPPGSALSQTWPPPQTPAAHAPDPAKLDGDVKAHRGLYEALEDKAWLETKFSRSGAPHPGDGWPNPPGGPGEAAGSEPHCPLGWPNPGGGAGDPLG